MASSFTFVNVSDAPGLGPKEAKQMRAHVTKTNFAKRRQKLGKDKKSKDIIQSKPIASDLPGFDDQRLWRMVDGSALSPRSELLLTSMLDPTCSPIGYLLCEYRTLIFPTGTVAPGSTRETDWISLLHSEPALVEASMAIAMRHSPRFQNSQTRREASLRKGRAIQLINQRLGTPLGLTDGVLSAVFTLTFAELLESDLGARDIHIQGLAQMIKVRRSSGNTAIPSWFGDFIL
ncbi:hypothetical protein F53441_1937 [Fusarium austroafricanum]|uniref:Uncharacterized protein n=1 Tax=Fusarium austroafricanum TaxID=2364996 RepID=A0A8H4KU50_9HYPO|nr:hypothetical protein F53441_1937 [Fusarium austroafricanum]